MDQILVLLLGVASGLTQTQVAVPMHEIKAEVETTALLEGISHISAEYSGTVTKICEAYPLRVQFKSFSLRTLPDDALIDGRYGATLQFDTTADIICGPHPPTNIVCRGNVSVAGFLARGTKPLAECFSPKYKVASIGFDLFALPPLLTEGVPIALAGCEQSGAESACAHWATKTDAGEYVLDTSHYRSIKLATRVFSTSSQDERHTSLVFNSHVGARADLSKTFDSRDAALGYIGGFEQNRPGFRARIGLEAIDDVRSLDGRVLDKGVFSQVLPILLEGSFDPRYLPQIDYKVALDNFSLRDVVHAGRNAKLLEINGYLASLKWKMSARPVPLFKRARLRLVITGARLSPDGAVSLVLSDADMAITALGGVLSLNLGGELLARQLDQLFSNVPVASIDTKFDLSMPRCIEVMGDHLDDAMSNCVEAGLLKHVAGVRGVRMVLTQGNVDVSDQFDWIEITGDTSVELVGPNP